MLLAAPAAAAETPPPQTMHLDAVSMPAGRADADPSASLAMQSDGHQRMTIPVSLGSKSFRFLVDTGSDRTSVSRQLARELGLEQRAGTIMHSATGQSRVSLAHLPELTLDRRKVRNINAPMLDAQDMGADGILGIDSLRSQRVVFDFARGKLAIHSAGDHWAAEEGAIIVRARRREGRLVVTDATIEGERVTVVLDSGSSVSVGNQALLRKLARNRVIGPTSPVELISVTGATLSGQLVIIRQFEIGGARLEGMGMVFADAHTFDLLKLDRKPAMLLGMDALMGFDQVVIDFAGKTLSLVLPKPAKGTPRA